MKKGNQWYFGMKAHIGVDAESGLAVRLFTNRSKRLRSPRRNRILRLYVNWVR